ncbi:unnamed protein product [Enterobius vermicularis]|uniref:Nucleoporin n=1 Tax=Enterobius vermicularis TaxID=51028 RepID=A0A0N4VLG0_ENTVE|nr:unnamed protein product [Enterobius vermicularis]
MDTFGSVLAPLSADILEFNEGCLESANLFRDLINSYQGSLLDLSATVIHLELDIKNGLKNFNDEDSNGIDADKQAVGNRAYNSPSHRSTLRDPYVPMVELKLFLATVMNALKKQPFRHKQWQSFLLRILPFLDRSLPTLSTYVVEQLRKNIEYVVRVAYQAYVTDELPFIVEDHRVPLIISPNDVQSYPTNYAIGAFETLTTFIHFCLLEISPQSLSPASGTTSAHLNAAAAQVPTLSSSLSSSMLSAIPGTKGATDLISNVFKAFLFSDSSSMTASRMKYVDRDDGSWTEAKVKMLNAFPVTLATSKGIVHGVSGYGVLYDLELKRLILDFLSPILENYQQAFLSAVSYVWLTRSSLSTDRICTVNESEVSFTYTDTQMDVANLLLNIEKFSFDNLVSTVTYLIKDCVGKSGKQSGPAVEKVQNVYGVEATALLEVLHGCLKAQSRPSLLSCWRPLQSLFSESPLSNLPPRAIFLEFMILADYVRFCGSSSTFEGKQEIRAMQDACQKLTDAVNVIIGWQLEQTTWLKRTLVVKHDSGTDPASLGLKSQDGSPVSESVTTPSSINVSEASSFRGSTASLVPPKLATFDTQNISTVNSLSGLSERKSSPVLRSSIKDSISNKRDPTFSIQALTLLAENLADLIDSVCKSEDKERLLLTLQSVWNNTLPYLKAKQ